MSDMHIKAYFDATRLHEGQSRKYTSEPYINHPIRVAKLVLKHGGSGHMVIAAFLHDVVEDCGVSHEYVSENYGPYVAQLVWFLTKLEIPRSNRAMRKRMSELQLSIAPVEARKIKCCDLLDNAVSIKEHDPKFWEVYKEEAKSLLKVFVEAGMPEKYEPFDMVWNIIHDEEALAPETQG